MRILIWAEFFWPLIGGVEVRLLHLLKALQEQGHETEVITNRLPAAPLEFETWKGIPIHRLETRQALAGRDLRRLRAVQIRALEIKRAFDPDVEHVVCSGPGVMLPQLCHREMPRPMIVTLHHDFGELFRRHANAAFVSLFRQASVIVVLSRPMRNEFEAKFPDLAHRVKLVTSGLPWPEAKPRALPFDPPLLLCLGRLVSDKGFDLALRAFGFVAEEFPDSKMQVAGDGSERPALEKLARALGLEQRVIFTGWVEPARVADLINQATLLIVPSRNQEPSAVVLREAAQMGRPVVATRVGGTPDLIEDGVNGLLVESERVEAIAAAILRLLRHPEEARKLGGEARRLAFDRFDFQRYLDHILLLYRKAQDECRPATPSSMAVPAR